MVSPQILVSHALGDAFSPFLVGVLSDWIRPALKPLDSAVPNVTVSASVLPYGAPIFNNADTDMVIIHPQSILQLFILPDTPRVCLFLNRFVTSPRKNMTLNSAVFSTLSSHLASSRY